MKHTLTIILVLPLLLLAACHGKPDSAVPTQQLPQLRPELAGAVLPVNIAAPSFMIADTAEYYHTEIGRAGHEPCITISSSSAAVMPPLDKWHDLLSDAAGDSIYIRITLERGGEALQLRDAVCHVSPDTIDRYLVYRLLYPGYELWHDMGIYQRDLTNYEQVAVLDNSEFDRQCVNCHSFVGGSPETMMVHVRGAKGGTIIRRDGKVVKVSPNCPALENGAAYPAWHPSGRFIAFANNDIKQFFHTSGTKTIEVSDLAADLSIYDVDADTASAIQGLSSKEWMETFPAWAPDGRALYFCRARQYHEGGALDSIRYDLCRASFDPASRVFGEPEIVVAAADSMRSVSFPRVSPDGRYLLYTLSSYGNFSIWHPESNLWLLDLTDGITRPMDELNSDDVDSYHSWSANGRWIVFSSKRMDGLWARPFIAAFDPSTGQASAPFAVPQQTPLFYDDFMRTFNIPELIRTPITDMRQLVDAANAPKPQ